MTDEEIYWDLELYSRDQGPSIGQGYDVTYLGMGSADTATGSRAERNFLLFSLMLLIAFSTFKALAAKCLVSYSMAINND